MERTGEERRKRERGRENEQEVGGERGKEVTRPFLKLMETTTKYFSP